MLQPSSYPRNRSGLTVSERPQPIQQPAARVDTVGMDASVTPAKKVFIVEDSPSVRVRLIEMIESVEGTQIVGQAETPQDAVDGILASGPDCIVLDLHLRGGSGLDVLRGVRAQGCECSVVVLTNHPDRAYRAACFTLGADWFFDKTNEFDEVVAVVAAINPLARPD
jgi:DNA-binding NarL/FixJ family response regulator